MGITPEERVTIEALRKECWYCRQPLDLTLEDKDREAFQHSRECPYFNPPLEANDHPLDDPILGVDYNLGSDIAQEILRQCNIKGEDDNDETTSV